MNLRRENMGKRNRSPSSSPLATVDDIQKRLVRPSSIISSPENVQGRNCLPLKRTQTQFQRKQEAKEGELTKNKLEDYLDPLLLSSISAKIGPVKKDEATEMKLKSKREVSDFDWPVDELKVLVAESRSNKRANLTNNELLNLSCDLDLSEENRDGEGEICTPFKRFEKTALKRFKR